MSRLRYETRTPKGPRTVHVDSFELPEALANLLRTIRDVDKTCSGPGGAIARVKVAFEEVEKHLVEEPPRDENEQREQMEAHYAQAQLYHRRHEPYFHLRAWMRDATAERDVADVFIDPDSSEYGDARAWEEFCNLCAEVGLDPKK